MKYKILKRPYGFECIFTGKRSGQEDITSSFVTDALLTDVQYTTKIAAEVQRYKDAEIAVKKRSEDDAIQIKLQTRAERKQLAVDFEKQNASATLQQFIDAIDGGVI